MKLLPLLFLSLCLIGNLLADTEHLSQWQGIEDRVSAGRFVEAIALFERSDYDVSRTIPTRVLVAVVIAYDELDNERATLLTLDSIRSGLLADKARLTNRTIGMILGRLDRYSFRQPSAKLRYQKIAAEVRRP